MGCHNVVEIYRCDAQSITKAQTDTTSVLYVQVRFRSRMFSAAWLHVQLFACASNISFDVSGGISLLWLFTWLPVYSLSGWSQSKYSGSISGCPIFFSVPSVLILEGVLGDWCLVPASWASSEAISSCRDPHLANLPVMSGKVENQFNTTWLACILRHLCPRYSCSNNNADTIARHFSWVLFNFCLSLFCGCDQYIICCLVKSSFF